MTLWLLFKRIVSIPIVSWLDWGVMTLGQVSIAIVCWLDWGVMTLGQVIDFEFRFHSGNITMSQL